MAGIVNKAAVDFIKNKKLKVGFSYKDVWHEEHATAFTVAKAMQTDVLKDIQDSVVQSIEKGETFEHFKKNLKPVLQQKGWWGKKEMTDPLTGETVNAQLGSDRRLKTIYSTNIRSAYQQGKWERTQASDAHPYLMYRVGNSKEHRREHLEWDGLILPKDDPWWNSHFPPNGWGCKCWTQAVSAARAEKLKQSGFTVPPTSDGGPGYTVHVKTQAPPVRYVSFLNGRKGTIEKIPQGVDPAFNWNVGRMGREVSSFTSFMKKGSDGKFGADIDAVAKSILTNKIMRAEFSAFVDRSLGGQIASGSKSIAAGFIEKPVADWLKKMPVLRLVTALLYHWNRVF